MCGFLAGAVSEYFFYFRIHSAKIYSGKVFLLVANDVRQRVKEA